MSLMIVPILALAYFPISIVRTEKRNYKCAIIEQDFNGSTHHIHHSACENISEKAFVPSEIERNRGDFIEASFPDLTQLPLISQKLLCCFHMLNLMCQVVGVLF